MPGRNLVTTRSFTYVATMISLVGLMVMTGCTKLTPRTLQDIVNDTPNAWESKSYDEDDFYMAPDAHEHIQAKAKKDALENSNASIVLPEESQSVASVLPSEALEKVVASAAVATNLVPDAELVGQPLRPLSFDPTSRVKINNDELQSLRNENVIRLTADPTSLAEQTPNTPPVEEAASSSVEPIVVQNLEPTPQPTRQLVKTKPAMLPPLQIVDARHLPSPDQRVELPQLPKKSSSTKPPVEVSTPWESGDTASLEGVAVSKNILVPVASTRRPAPAVKMDPPFAEPPAKKPLAKVVKPAPTNLVVNREESTNDFQLPMFEDPPELVVYPDGISASELTPATKPAGKIAAHVSAEAELKGFETESNVGASRIEKVAAHVPLTKTTPVSPPVAKTPKMTPLKLANANFCSSVLGFGQFEPFAQNLFRAKQKLLMYCEIENFKSTTESVDGQETFKTRLQGTYKVYDHENKLIDEFKFPVVEDVARNQRRDFYVHLPIHLGTWPAGNYSIQLEVIDLTSDTIATLASPIGFSIR